MWYCTVQILSDLAAMEVDAKRWSSNFIGNSVSGVVPATTSRMLSKKLTSFATRKKEQRALENVIARDKRGKHGKDKHPQPETGLHAASFEVVTIAEAILMKLIESNLF